MHLSIVVEAQVVQILLDLVGPVEEHHPVGVKYNRYIKYTVGTQPGYVVGHSYWSLASEGFRGLGFKF